MLNTIHRLRHGILLLLFMATSAGFSQNALQISYDHSDIHQPATACKDPAKLAESLTRSKGSEKEKFDAIFAWVATNIDYDYRAYYSSSGSTGPDVKKILKKKKGICLDYAGLMDTLCELAGLKNFTVYGYAKEETFDVQDSIYLDNHAWNAVKLDGLWYVYDVTWASGEVEYYYAKRSQRVLRWIAKFKPRYKSKTIKGWDPKDICTKTGTFKKEEQTITWKTYRFNWLRNFLLKRTLIIKSRQSDKIDSTWYLTDPKIFAITHFPDDPNWSLLPQHTMRDFESDSAYYNLNDSVYASQQRQGFACSECDFTSGADELKFHTDLRKKSMDFNPRNHYSTSMCEAIIARNFFIQSLPMEDSLKKVSTIDTSLAWIERAKKSLGKAAADATTNNKLQQEKNRKKNTILRDDYAAHTKFIETVAGKTAQRIKTTKTHISKRKRLVTKYEERNKKINKYKIDVDVKKNNRQDTVLVNKLRRDVKKKEHATDSIQKLINEQRLVFDKLSPLLVDKALTKVNEFDTLIKPYYIKYYHRVMYRDDYKKPVVQAKQKLDRFEKNYSDELDSTLYAFSDSLIRLNERIAALVEARTLITKDLFTLKAKQVKMGAMPIDEIWLYKRQLHDDNVDDFCWVRSGYTRVALAYYCFDLLKKQQESVKIVLKRELDAEAKRNSFVSKELLRKTRKYSTIASTNKTVVSQMEKSVKDSKQKYLRKLKDEARAAKQGK